MQLPQHPPPPGVPRQASCVKLPRMSVAKIEGKKSKKRRAAVKCAVVDQPGPMACLGCHTSSFWLFRPSPFPTAHRVVPGCSALAHPLHLWGTGVMGLENEESSTDFLTGSSMADGWNYPQGRENGERREQIWTAGFGLMLCYAPCMRPQCGGTLLSANSHRGNGESEGFVCVIRSPLLLKCHCTFKYPHNEWENLMQSLHKQLPFTYISAHPPSCTFPSN